MNWLHETVRKPHVGVLARARRRQATLTKPKGALGELENLAIRLAALQQTDTPRATQISIVIFVADHGIAQAGVSAYPQTVTTQMLENFLSGGAAISVLARQLGAHLQVVNLGTLEHLKTDDPKLIDARIGPGTANFLNHPAMSESQLLQALEAGRQAFERTQPCDVFIGGEMGIGNTTSASAITCSLLPATAGTVVGPGTGLDSAGITRKRQLIERALELHCTHRDSPLEVLRTFGGFEIAALVGAYLRAAQLGSPIVLDGFISSAAALVAERFKPGVRQWFVHSHRSTEPGHQLILNALEARPLLDLQLRLGEGSGAAIAVPLLQHACALHNDMATFGEAGVDQP